MRKKLHFKTLLISCAITMAASAMSLTPCAATAASGESGSETATEMVAQETETSAPFTEVPQTEVPQTEATEALQTETAAEETALWEEDWTESQQTEAWTESQTETEQSSNSKNGSTTEQQTTTETTSSAESTKEEEEKDLVTVPLGYPAANITENTKQIYFYLVDELGLNHAAACGVLANIQMESNFNQLAIGDGGTSYGLCQWHNERYTRLVAYCSSASLDHNTVEGQMGYLATELSSNYQNVLNYLRNVPDTADGSYEAAYYWCTHFEVPSDTHNKAVQRGNLAKAEYYPKTFYRVNDGVRTELQERIDKTLENIKKNLK